MKYQALFYRKTMKYSRLSSAAVVIGALSVKMSPILLVYCVSCMTGRKVQLSWNK